MCHLGDQMTSMTGDKHYSNGQLFVKPLVRNEGRIHEVTKHNDLRGNTSEIWKTSKIRSLFAMNYFANEIACFLRKHPRNSTFIRRIVHSVSLDIHRLRRLDLVCRMISLSSKTPLSLI